MNTENQNKDTKQVNDLHPSGLTWERWRCVFKMPHERKMIQEWMQRKTGQDLNDGSTPF